MDSTGRFTPALHRLVYHSHDMCGRCGARMDHQTAALAGYDADGKEAYVGPCCEGVLTERASNIYWNWEPDRRCAPSQKLWRYMDLAKFLSLLEDRFISRAPTNSATRSRARPASPSVNRCGTGTIRTSSGARC